MFAQVIRGRVVDRDAMAARLRRWAADVAPAAPGWRDATGGVTDDGELIDEPFRRWRPDAVGGYRVWLPDGRMLAVDCFSSEAEARAGEQSEPPQEVAEAFPRWLAQISDQEWFDLREPWMAVSPQG